MNPEAAMRYLGIAKKAGRLELGEEPVAAACRSGKARLVLLSRDAGDHTRRRTANRCGDSPPLTLPYGKEELGRALGRKTCAVLAVTDSGLAQAIHKTLAAPDSSGEGEGKRNPNETRWVSL